MWIPSDLFKPKVWYKTLDQESDYYIAFLFLVVFLRNHSLHVWCHPCRDTDNGLTRAVEQVSRLFKTRHVKLIRDFTYKSKIRTWIIPTWDLQRLSVGRSPNWHAIPQGGKYGPNRVLTLSAPHSPFLGRPLSFSYFYTIVVIFLKSPLNIFVGCG